MTKVKQTPEQQIAGIVQRLANNSLSKEHSNLFRLSKVLLQEINSYTGSKETEKHLIDMLKLTEGYFAQEFTPAEIDRMKYNIASDFPIFLETCVGNLQEQVKQLSNNVENLRAEMTAKNNTIEALSGEIKERNSQLSYLLYDLIDLQNEGGMDLNLHFSKEAIIIAKLHAGQVLTPEEVTFVSSNFKQP